jgi:hypothetical protein
MKKSENLICLHARGIGYILNSECRTSEEADTLLADRVANNQAFDNEKVVVTSRKRYEAAHRSEPAIAVAR